MQKIRSAVATKALALSIFAVGLIADASAALPESVATTVTSIQTDGKAIFDLVFPVVGVFLGLMIVIKLFKRFSNKL